MSSEVRELQENEMTEPSQDPVPTDLTLSQESASLTEGESLEINVTTPAANFTAESADAEKATATANVEQKKIAIQALKPGQVEIIVKAKDGENLETVKKLTLNIAERVQELTSLSLSKESSEVKVDATDTITVTTDADSVTASADNENVQVSVEGKVVTLRGQTFGRSVVTIRAQAAGKTEVTKQVNVTILNKDSLAPDKTTDAEEYYKQSAGTVYIPSQESEAEKWLEAVASFENTSSLTLEQTVKVSAWNKIAFGNFEKSYRLKVLIKEMASNKVGRVRFINDARAKSAIALIRDLTKEQYGSELSKIQKVRIIRNILDAHNIKVR